MCLISFIRLQHSLIWKTFLYQDEIKQQQKTLDEINGRMFPKVLIFITTHFSTSHIEFFQRCWPYSIAKSPLLQNSDFFVFSTGATNKSLLKGLFVHNKLEIYEVENPGYDAGSNLGLDLGQHYGWFDSYDWVIRLNPDVIIRNDTYILNNIMDPNLEGIFINCLPGRAEQLHTDWSAFRPSTLPEENALSKRKHSESKFTIDMQSVLKERNFVWLPRSQPVKFGICRVVGDAVLHDHKYLDYCEDDLRGNHTYVIES